MPWLFAAYAAVSIYATITGSQAQAAAQREQADISRIQGEISVMQAEAQAKMELKVGREQADYIRKQSAQVVGSEVTKTAASGIELSGSPMAVIADQIWADERNAATAITNASARAGRVKAEGYAAQTQARANASALRSQANYTEQAGWLKSIAIGLGTYAGYQQMTGGAPSTSPGSRSNTMAPWDYVDYSGGGSNVG